MSFIRLSVLALWLLAALLITGCNKGGGEDEGRQLDLDDGPGISTSDVPPAQGTDTGFIPETPEQPLAQSTLEMDGIRLGTGLTEARERLASAGTGVAETWYEEESTGIIASNPVDGSTGGDGVRQEIAYLHDGGLVGFQRLVDMDRDAFDAMVTDYIAHYGQPVEEPPYFITASNFYYLFDNEKTGELLFWYDEPTRTAIAASLSKNEDQSVWVLFHPERLDSARSDTYASTGS